MLRTLLFWSLLAATVQPCLGTKCVGDNSVCHAYATSDVVFIGRVVERNPDVDYWGRNLGRELESLFPGRTMDDIENDESAETTAKLRQFYLSFVRGAASSMIAGARTGKQLRAALDELMQNGQTVRFEVHHAYKGLPPGHKEVEIQSDFSVGLPRFAAHESYLIYAHRGAGQRLEVGTCSRSQRVTFAGADLGYLHFIQYGGRRASRIYGFVTADKKDQRRLMDLGEVSQPVGDVLIALRAPGVVIYAATGPTGQFIFDGLEPGEYEATVYRYQDWYIEDDGKLGGPQMVKVNERGCERVLFQIDPPAKKE